MEMDEGKMHVQVKEMDGKPGLIMPTVLKTYGWVVLNALSFSWSILFSINAASEWLFEKYKIEERILGAYCSISFMPQLLGICLVNLWYAGMPNRLVGRKGKVLIELMTLSSAIILRQYLPYDGSYTRQVAVLLLVLLTVHLHSWGQILHRAWDISIYDVLLQVVMEVGTYMTRGDMMCFYLVIFFSGVTCVEFFSYSPPITPESIKKDLESSPC